MSITNKLVVLSAIIMFINITMVIGIYKEVVGIFSYTWLCVSDLGKSEDE